MQFAHLKLSSSSMAISDTRANLAKTTKHDAKKSELVSLLSDSIVPVI